LQQGTPYQFSAWVRARDLSSDQGPHFILGSIGGEQAAPLTTPDLLGTFDWR